MKTVNIHDAKTQLSRLLERAHAGEEIIIAKNGEPYARLVPLDIRAPKRHAGTLKGSVEISDDFFEPSHALSTSFSDKSVRPFSIMISS